MGEIQKMDRYSVVAKKKSFYTICVKIIKDHSALAHNIFTLEMFSDRIGQLDTIGKKKN